MYTSFQFNAYCFMWLLLVLLLSLCLSNSMHIAIIIMRGVCAFVSLCAILFHFNIGKK